MQEGVSRVDLRVALREEELVCSLQSLLRQLRVRGQKLDHGVTAAATDLSHQPDQIPVADHTESYVTRRFRRWPYGRLESWRRAIPLRRVSPPTWPSSGLPRLSAHRPSASMDRPSSMCRPR